MADKTSATGWDDKDRLVFFLDLLETGAIAIDWKKASLPPGKTRNACNKMLQRLKATHQKDLDNLKAARAGEGASEGKKSGKKGGGNTPTNRSPLKTKTSPLKRGSQARVEEDDDEEAVVVKKIKEEREEDDDEI